MSNTAVLTPPNAGGDWIGFSHAPLPTEQAAQWAILPSCGAVVSFAGVVRDNSGEVEGVVALDYEAYEEYLAKHLSVIADQARSRWPEIGRVVILHRLGVVALGEASVVVAVSTPHRAEAFSAAQFCIDTLKTSAPIWKKDQFGERSSSDTRRQHARVGGGT